MNTKVPIEVLAHRWWCRACGLLDGDDEDAKRHKDGEHQIFRVEPNPRFRRDAQPPGYYYESIDTDVKFGPVLLGGEES